MGSPWPCCILGWPYLVCSLIISWPSSVLLCAVSSFSMVFYFCPLGCFEIFILMGWILIHVLNFSLQTKSNPRIIYFCKIFNSPTGNYPKRMLHSLRIAKGVHSYWWVLPFFFVCLFSMPRHNRPCYLPYIFGSVVPRCWCTLLCMSPVTVTVP